MLLSMNTYFVYGINHPPIPPPNSSHHSFVIRTCLLLLLKSTPRVFLDNCRAGLEEGVDFTLIIVDHALDQVPI